ncbi:MAG: hypothetical protein SPJ62_15155 [Inconstantimicrobium porci]|uniref:hypothetical protein n=1 Tax=Inconstantimicrobium porci TaxID=2652291 RepID=UPI002A90F0B8|nr:hypothetical protein [Inconstantimicrobium porci]MDY5913309.1 hypothetical protein [Inconstantimicrobium porci]
MKCSRGWIPFSKKEFKKDYHSVTFIIDKDLKNKTLLAHPNVNTMTVSMEYSDLIKYIEYHHNKYYEI